MVTIKIPETTVKAVIKGIMDNFPEASNGCSLRCVGWHYKTLEFEFIDEESGKRYAVKEPELRKAFDLMFTDKWPKGCTQPLANVGAEAWEDWLCQADATDFDAFAQLACLGEVIYG